MQLAHAFYRDIPGWQQISDYQDRTDGQPVYHGRSLNEAAQDDPVWVITLFTYTAEGFMATGTCKVGAWVDRASLFV